MKNLYLKITKIILISLISNSLFAQENSISPIFGLTRHTGSMNNSFVSVNQISGKTIEIEAFSTEEFLGNNFTVSTIESSNVDKVYFLNNNNNLSVYDIPYFFEENYVGVKAEITINNHITDLDYHHQSALIYAFDLNSNNLYSIVPFSGTIQTTKNIIVSSSVEDFSIKTTNDYIILSALNNNLEKLIFHNISTNTETELNITTEYKSFNIVSNRNLSCIYAIAKDLQNKNWLIKIDPATATSQVIKSLPSCSDCTSEAFLFKKNGLAIDWENNELLAILNQKNNNTDHYHLFTFDLENGETVHFSSLDKETDNLYFNKASADLVFPGDANHDGIVNLKDIFSVGLKYTYNTTSRLSQNNLWIGQYGFNTGVIVQGVDAKHADCNGDGQINAIDVNVIKENYSYIHNSNKQVEVSDTDCDYPLAFSFTSLVFEDHEATINIKLGEITDPVSDVYGVNFTISYDKNFVVPNTMITQGMDSWFGIDNGTCIQNSIDDYGNGKIEVNITGTNLMNRSGGGDIITAIWTTEDDLVPGVNLTEEMSLKIENITIINYAEDVLPSCGEDTTVTVHHKSTVSIKTVENEIIEIYPNPTHSVFQITSDEKIESIQMISLTGKMVKSENLNLDKTIDVSNISKGVYFLKINVKNQTYFEKIIVN